MRRMLCSPSLRPSILVGLILGLPLVGHSAGTLQFESDFTNVTATDRQYLPGYDPNDPVKKWNVRWTHNQPVSDLSVATPPTGIHDWDKLRDNVKWLHPQLNDGLTPELYRTSEIYNQGGDVSVIDDPTSSGHGSILALENSSWGSGTIQSRSSVMLRQGWHGVHGDNLPQATEDQFTQQFFSYNVYIPTRMRDAFTEDDPNNPVGLEGWNSGTWVDIWDTHISNGEGGYEQTAHQLRIQPRFTGEYGSNTDDGRNYDYTDWHFDAVQYRYPGGTETPRWDNSTTFSGNPASWQQVAVPFGEWFTMEVFFKHHATDGRYYVAITPDGGTRQVISDYVGQTQFDGNPLWDVEFLKLYHHQRIIGNLQKQNLNDGFTTTFSDSSFLLYDNIQMWDDFPAGYFNPADYDGNGTVGVEDYAIWRTAFGSNVTAGTGADGNGDGVVDAADYNVWRDALAAAGMAPGIAVPTPSGLSLIGCCLLGLSELRRRR